MGLQKAIGVGDAVRYRTQYFIERDPTVVKIFIIDDIMKAIFFDILYRTVISITIPLFQIFDFRRSFSDFHKKTFDDRCFQNKDL